MEVAFKTSKLRKSILIPRILSEEIAIDGICDNVGEFDGACEVVGENVLDGLEEGINDGLSLGFIETVG